MTIIKSCSIKGKLTHWIYPNHVDKVLNGEFVLHFREGHNKPKGVWLSWNNGWERWCDSNKFGDLENKVCLKAKLKPGFKIWLIDSMDDFLDLWQEFKGKKIDPGDYSMNGMMALIKSGFWDWLRNKKQIGAIALTDKGQWATRMETWLYGWDCQSIVVFDPKNIILTKTD